jgi:aspartyl-tRNA(Asn)/glutamyl-tRNA(Gln) amidotransferase subunit B
MNSDFARLLNDTGQAARAQGTDPEGREASKVTPAHLVELTKAIADGTISGKIAKEVFDECFKTGKSPRAIVEEKGLTQITDTSFIESLIDDVLKDNSGQVETYKSGKTGVFGYLVGQAIQRSKGRANPQLVQQVLKRRLDG